MLFGIIVRLFLLSYINNLWNVPPNEGKGCLLTYLKMLRISMITKTVNIKFNKQDSLHNSTATVLLNRI